MKNNKYLSINSDNRNIREQLSNHLYNLITNTKKVYSDIAYVCIGTDRSTGDSLAPLVGYNLINKYSNVYGTIHNPVHAKNLEETMNKIDIENTLVIAIDACLGKMEHVGNIFINEGSLKPGAGIGKDLMEVGDISIAGIVNFGGFMDFMVLQNTRLSMVVNLSEIIIDVIDDVMMRLGINELKKLA